MTGNIFINNGREESGHVAGRLHDLLRFGPDPLGIADMTFCGANVRLCPKADIRPVAQRPGPELPPDPSVCYVEPVRRWMLGILGSRSMLTAELGPKRLGLLHQLLPDAAVVAMLINVSRDG